MTASQLGLAAAAGLVSGFINAVAGGGTFITFGALLTGGSAALARSLGPWATGLLVVSGLSSIATGLAPLDQDTTLHAMAATPLFVAQPIALIVLGVATAVAATHIAVRFDGANALGLWPGAGLSLAWWGIVGGATLTLDQLGRAEMDVPTLACDAVRDAVYLDVAHRQAVFLEAGPDAPEHCAHTRHQFSG